MTTVAITGHRDCTADPQELADLLQQWAGGNLVHGGAVGFDRQAAAAAVRLEYQVTAILPDWDRFGRSAGMRRNADIIARAVIGPYSVPGACCFPRRPTVPDARSVALRAVASSSRVPASATRGRCSSAVRSAGRTGRSSLRRR